MYHPKIRDAMIALVVGVGLIVYSLIALRPVDALRARTEQRVATVQDSQLYFTTISGQDIAVPLIAECKRRDPAGHGCIEPYQNGDQVLITYDSANPTHVWNGATPGGGWLIVALLVGVGLVTTSLLLFYFLLVMPKAKAILRSTPLGPRADQNR